MILLIILLLVAINDWRNHFIAENGDNYLDFLHPPLSQRAAALRKVLLTRSINV